MVQYNTAKDDDGWGMGQAATDKLSFYGATPIVRPTGPSAVDTTAGIVTGSIGFATSTQFNAVLTAVNALRANAVSLGLHTSA